MNPNQKRIGAPRLVLPLLLLGVTGHGPVVMAQSAGTFTATGNMTTPRSQHTATLLPDGRVLIAGGFVVIGQSVIRINSAELYDPSTGTFTVIGDMTRASFGHVATLLPDGRVLIIGARPGDAPGPLRAELFDPSTGTFTPTGSIMAALGPATLLRTGKVLITGGSNAKLYDPATGTFTATGEYAYAGDAAQITTTLLADGRVLFTWCANIENRYCESAPAEVAQLYNPATDTFSLTGAYGFWDSTTTLLTNGKVLFAGGTTDYSSYANAKLYDPSTGTFTPAGDMTIYRDGHTATLLPDGTVLITGGSWVHSDQNSNPSAELYGPSTGSFRFIGNMTARRGYHTATLLNDGRVLITGGTNSDIRAGRPFPSTSLSSAELYTPAVVVPAPALFSLSGDGQGQGAIWQAQTGQIASAGSPAVAGEVLSMYTTSLADGGVIPPQVAIGGRLAQVLYFGASGYPGYNQVNFRVPSSVAPGAAISVRLTYLSRPSNAVTLGVR